MTVKDVVEVAVGVAVLLGGGGAGALHLRNTWGAQWLAATLPRVVVEARAAVLEVAQTYTDAILKARQADSPGGAELTEDEKREALRRAVATFTANFGRKGLHRLARIFGIEDPVAYATTHVEAAVNAAKTEARASGAALAVAPAPVVADDSLVFRRAPAPAGKVGGRAVDPNADTRPLAPVAPPVAPATPPPLPPPPGKTPGK